MIFRLETSMKLDCIFGTFRFDGATRNGSHEMWCDWKPRFGGMVWRWALGQHCILMILSLDLWLILPCLQLPL